MFQLAVQKRIQAGQHGGHDGGAAQRPNSKTMSPPSALCRKLSLTTAFPPRRNRKSCPAMWAGAACRRRSTRTTNSGRTNLPSLSFFAKSWVSNLNHRVPTYRTIFDELALIISYSLFIRYRTYKYNENENQ